MKFGNIFEKLKEETGKLRMRMTMNKIKEPERGSEDLPEEKLSGIAEEVTNAREETSQEIRNTFKDYDDAYARFPEVFRDGILK